MWWKQKLKQPVTLYCVLLFLILTQVLVAMQFYKEGDAYLAYKLETRGFIQYMRGVSNEFTTSLMTRGNTPEERKAKEWATFCQKVEDYTRKLFWERYHEAERTKGAVLKRNVDMSVLGDLALFYGYDFQTYKRPRPEQVLGREKWEKLRAYFSKENTPEWIREALLYPYDRYLNGHENEAPVLQDRISYFFRLESLEAEVDRLLAEDPQLPYHTGAPANLLTQLFGNRLFLLVYYLLCLLLTATLLAEDRQLGTIKLLTCCPYGRERYFLRAYGQSMGFLLGLLVLALLPGLALGLLRFGISGFRYPTSWFPYSYEHWTAFPIDLGKLGTYTTGLSPRWRPVAYVPRNLGEMYLPIELGKLLVLALVFLVLLTSLLVLIGFLLSTLHRNKAVTAALALLPLGLVAVSLYVPSVASASFPYNPLAGVDLMAVAPGIHYFSSLSCLVLLLVWNLVFFLLGFWRMRRMGVA